MKRLLPSSLAALLLSCTSTEGPRTVDPVAVKAAPLAGVTSCGIYGDVQDGKRCRFYDKKQKAFVDDASVDPLLRRNALYERWLDKHLTVEGQVVERRHTIPMLPEDAESKWSDEQYLEAFDDYGDSANWTGHAGIAATFRYATTGTEADYARMLKFLNADLLDFEATGIDGYLARFHTAATAPGTKIRNGYAMVTRDAGDPNRFDIAPEKIAKFPAYYTQGIPKADGSGTTPALPSWIGHPSIDAYSGPWNFFPLAYALVKDPAIKEQMARHFTCSIKRLRIARIINLTKNPQLLDDVSKYLTSGTHTPDADDPDLTKIDEVWGFYLPQVNVNNKADYPRDCPATMAFEPTETIDVTEPGFTGKVLIFFLRQAGGDKKDAIDFAFYPSVRAGDAVMLDSYALAAYHMTKDTQYLRWRDEVLFARAKSREVERTAGAFHIPKACANYYRIQNVYTAHFHRLLLDSDADSKAHARLIWDKKYFAKEMEDMNDSMFEIMFAGTTGQTGPRLDNALAELRSLGGTTALLESPRRNYDLDSSVSPPAGYTVAAPPQADRDLCEAGVTLLGINIPGEKTNPDDRYANRGLPVMARPTQCFAWEKDPFNARRVQGAGESGRQQYEGLDLSMPYWFGRYFGSIPDPDVVLAWENF